MMVTMIGKVAEAGETVTATVTIGTVSVTVSPTAFDYGTMPFSTVKESFDTTGEPLHNKNISATVGTLVTDLDIKGAVTTGWTTLHLTAPGVNTYVHKFGTSTSEIIRPSSYAGLTTGFDTVLAADVAADGVVWFGLQILTPTSGVTTQQSAAVTLRATWSQ